MSDTILRFAVKTRLFSDTSNIAELVTQSSAREITKTLSDTVLISEGQAIAKTKQRIISQTVTISDELVTEITHTTRNRTLSEEVSISDAVSKSTVRDIIKTLSDTVTISELRTGLRTKQRTILQSVNIAETLQAYKNDELLIPPIPPAPPQIPSLIGTRERAVRAVRRAPRAIIIDEIKNVAIAPLKLLAFSDSINKAIVGIKPRPTPNVALSELILARSPLMMAESRIKIQPEPMILKARLCLPLSSLNLTTAKLKLRPQIQSIHAVKAVNFEKMHKLTRIMKIAMLIENI